MGKRKKRLGLGPAHTKYIFHYTFFQEFSPTGSVMPATVEPQVHPWRIYRRRGRRSRREGFAE